MLAITKSAFADPMAGLTRNVNPYVEKLRAAKSIGTLPLTFGSEINTAKGVWRQKFLEFLPPGSTPPKKLFLEIGCYKGQTLIAMAKANPDVGFIGIDITFKRIMLSVERIAGQNINNAICMMVDGRFVGEIFESDELDGIIIFFPDPWKKRRHEKNRLLSNDFATAAHKVLSPHGFIWLKTDEQEYYNFANANLMANNFRELTSDDAFFSSPWPSAFEDHFVQKNTPFFNQVWQKI